MKISLKLTMACTLLGVGFFTATPQSHAALLAYEGFNYPAGNINGQNGGTGWSTAWVSSTSPVYASVETGTSLSYTGGSINVSGGGSALSIVGGTAGGLNRSFVAATGGSEVYFSFLFQSVAGSGDEFFQFFLSDDADTNNSGGIGDFLTAAASPTFGVRINTGSGDTTTSSGETYSTGTGTTYLLVGRLSTDGSSGPSADIIDRVELWVNPTSLTLGAADATANASTGVAITNLDYFSTRFVNFTGSDEILIDELRIGTDFASVVTVPEPSVAGLLFLGGVSLFALRRKVVR